jgi:hypothetical protein
MVTVKQLIEAHVNRVNKNVYKRVHFEKRGKEEGYTNVTNVYRDGVKVDKLTLDKEPHGYEFEWGLDKHSYMSKQITWIRVTFVGKIVEIVEDI